MRGFFCVLLAAAILLAGAIANAQGAPSQGSGDLVARGEYLSRLGDCEGCHTAKGGAPFAGGLKIDTPFGYLLSSNITPDKDAGIGTWSAADLYRSMHFGLNKKRQYLFPAMPYTFYSKVTRDDVEAIWAYLQTVKPVKAAVDVNHLGFPFDIRLTMLAWNELYFRPGTYVENRTRSEQWNRGAYIVEGLGHCSACHSPRNFMGAIEKNERFTGAEIDSWFAPNISTNLRTGIGAWSVDEIAAWLKNGYASPSNPRGVARRPDRGGTTAVGPMAVVWHDSLRYLSDGDAKAMAVYLKSLPAETPSSAKAERARRPATSPLGARVYIENCSGCHRANGGGFTDADEGPSLAGNQLVVAPNPDSLLSVILGGQSAVHRAGPMPAFTKEFSDAEVAAVASYVRTHWGNTASEVTAQQVAAFRREFFAAKPRP